jgi:hypothetical protein
MGGKNYHFNCQKKDMKRQHTGDQLTDLDVYLNADPLVEDCSQTDDLLQVYGLEPMKQLLSACVKQPLVAKQHYLPDGTMPVQRVLFVYGAEGAGKAYGVRVFARANRINLVQLDVSRFDPTTHIPQAYEWAFAHRPAIVLFRDCEGAFHPSAAEASGLLCRELERMASYDATVWTVFVSQVIPASGRNLAFSVSASLERVVWCGMLDETARERCLLAALQQRVAARFDPESCKLLLAPAFIQHLVHSSEHCTAAEIFNFITEAFRARLQRFDIEAATMSANDPRLVPPPEEINERLVPDGAPGRYRLTRYLAVDKNTAPYSIQPQ